MDFELENKSALVSGSSQGIGFAIAEALAKEGVNVVINSNNTNQVDEAVDKLSKVAPGVRISGAVADLSTAEGVQELVENAAAVDILVNNVGFYSAKEFQEITDADWDRIMNLNFMSGVRLSRAFLSWYENTWLGPHRFHFKRIGSENSSGNDSLRGLQGRTDRGCSWHRRDDYRYADYGQQRASRSDEI